MLSPPILMDIDGLVASRSDWSSTVPSSMGSVLVVIAPIIVELVLQVSHSPEKCMIQPLPPNASYQSFHKRGET